MRSAGRVFIIMVVSAVILFAVVCGALFAFQRSLIYYPQPRSNPEGSILMTLPVGTATVHVSTRPHVGPAALIYFGGNAEDVSQDIPDLADEFPDRPFTRFTTRATAEVRVVRHRKPSSPPR